MSNAPGNPWAANGTGKKAKILCGSCGDGYKPIPTRMPPTSKLPQQSYKI